jgi:hypothetical protein
MAYPTYQRPLRNICPLGENARLSIKRDSYADFSLCANWPILPGSLDIFYPHTRKTAIAQPLSLVRNAAFIPTLKKTGALSGGDGKCTCKEEGKCSHYRQIFFSISKSFLTFWAEIFKLRIAI